MKLRSALLAATVLAAPVAAKAEAVNGLYIGAGAGANFLQDESIDSINVTPGGSRTRLNTVFAGGSPSIKYDTGFVLVGSVGYGLGNGLRVEGEYSYRQNKGSNFNGFRGSGFTSAGGDQQKHTAMVNVLYDFDPNVLGLGFFPFPITPYVGVGAGYSWVKNSNFRINGFSGPVAGFPNGFRTLLRSTHGDGSFAYQGIVGAAFPLSAVPGLSLTAEYRFLGLAEDRTTNYQFFAPNVATRARVTTSDNYNHSVLVGVRYAFNAAPPPAPIPPPAVQQVVPARTYLVFFDWDRADLTNRARQIIAEAASAAQRTQVTRIEVSGHTDKSGTPAYNQRLSVRRANNVAAELVRLGVPRQAILVAGFGESRPLVPTADGVREPQNRRVEIVFR